MKLRLMLVDLRFSSMVYPSVTRVSVHSTAAGARWRHTLLGGQDYSAQSDAPRREGDLKGDHRSRPKEGGSSHP